MRAHAPMRNAFKAGAAYFLAVFSVAFILGIFRVGVLVPRMGELMAVSLEAPVILGLSWLASRWATKRYRLPRDVAPRLAMGAIAFSLLMIVELAVSTLAFGQPAAEYFDAIWSAPGVVGLGAQIVFAFIPPIQGTMR